ncbi:hypothetical protein L1887_16406 [Cichorium endivia]|nr:hypothetical protein L1887_16406 [Cichorium endivia]
MLTDFRPCHLGRTWEIHVCYPLALLFLEVRLDVLPLIMHKAFDLDSEKTGSYLQTESLGVLEIYIKVGI